MILKEHILDDTTLMLIHSCNESTDSLRITYVDVDLVVYARNHGKIIEMRKS